MCGRLANIFYKLIHVQKIQSTVYRYIIKFSVENIDKTKNSIHILFKHYKKKFYWKP